MIKACLWLGLALVLPLGASANPSVSSPTAEKAPASRDEVVDDLMRDILSRVASKMTSWGAKPKNTSYEEWFASHWGPEAKSLIRSQRKVWHQVANEDRDLKTLEGNEFRLRFLKHTKPNRNPKTFPTVQDLESLTTKSANVTEVFARALDAAYLDIFKETKFETVAGAPLEDQKTSDGAMPAKQETTK